MTSETLQDMEIYINYLAIMYSLCGAGVQGVSELLPSF
jgi:hypothetical protein